MYGLLGHGRGSAAHIRATEDANQSGEVMTQPTYDFTGRVALVTGAGSGMGAETARWFARAGAGVVLADIQEPLAQSVAKELSEAGLAATAIHCDVADEDQV